MHLADGTLPPLHCAIYFAIVIPVVLYGIVKLRENIRKYGTEYVKLFLLLMAIVFVLSGWHIPVPVAGSCSHPCGTPLAGLILSIPEIFLMSFCVLILQALYGHGGFTTLGANTLSLALIPAVLSYFVRKIVLRMDKGPARSAILFISGVVGDLGVYLTTSIELALAWGHTITKILQLIGTIFMLYMPVQFPISLIDGIVNMKLFDYIVNKFDITKEILHVVPIQQKA
ncbi:MAG: hypothetical protein GXO23_05880 [Crenarchaeota archaeon]|nr:hypothetical protein [Thermoproteota archaeon]